MNKIISLIKINAWYAFACGIFCLLVAPLIVELSLLSRGLKPVQIFHDDIFFLAASFVRLVGILFFGYAMSLRLILKQNFDPENLRAFFGLLVVGAIVWGGTFLFVTSTQSILLATVLAIGLLEWLLLPLVMLFEYKKPQDWEDVKPKK